MSRNNPTQGWRRAIGWLGFAALVLPPAASAAPNYRLDPTHTAIHWEVVHMGTSTSRGRFERITGQVSLEPGQQLAVRIEVETASVSTGIPTFDAVLKRPSLLDVAAHPLARFESERIEWREDGFSPAQVHGRLMIKGRSQPLTLISERWRCGNNPLFGREVCGGDFVARLSRAAIGMGMAAGMVEDTVTLRVQVEAIRLEAAETTVP